MTHTVHNCHLIFIRLFAPLVGRNARMDLQTAGQIEHVTRFPNRGSESVPASS